MPRCGAASFPDATRAAPSPIPAQPPKHIGHLMFPAYPHPNAAAPFIERLSSCKRPLGAGSLIGALRLTCDRVTQLDLSGLVTSGFGQTPLVASVISFLQGSGMLSVLSRVAFPGPLSAQ